MSLSVLTIKLIFFHALIDLRLKDHVVPMSMESRTNGKDIHLHSALSLIDKEENKLKDDFMNKSEDENIIKQSDTSK